AVSEFLEQAFGACADILIVVDDQNQSAAVAGISVLGSSGARHRAIRAGKNDDAGRPFTLGTSDSHVASGLLCESVDLTQSQTRSLAGRLGREERLENLVECVGIDTSARVCNRNCSRR